VPRIARHGTFNMLLSNGAGAVGPRQSTKLCYVVRQHPFATARLSRRGPVASTSPNTHTPDDRVAVVATTPLTCDEQSGRPSRPAN
jgi:predicted glutamine amidotransferase